MAQTLYSDYAQLCEAISYELQAAPCFDEKNGVYYLYGNPETGEISAYDFPTSEHIMFSAKFYGNWNNAICDYEWEYNENPDFRRVVENLADQWREKYSSREKMPFIAEW